MLLLLILVFAVAGILVVKTLLTPAPGSGKAQALLPFPDSALQHFQHAIQVPTVSLGDTKPVDTAAFIAFRQMIETSYPLVHQQLSRQAFNQFSYLYTWKGKDTTLAPYIFMGHYDVVPVEGVAEKMWRQKPFSGALVGDTVWGRGACDDKGSVIAILEAVESLLKSGFAPGRTIYLSFGHDEEIGGHRGANAIAGYLKSKGVKADFVMDEGGMINTDKRFSAYPLGIIGVQEKGYASYKLTVEKPGGHSSQPEVETAIDILAKGLAKLREHPAPATITPVMREFLQASAIASSSFISKMAIQNQWLLGAVLKTELTKDKRTSAMIRTTIVPTMLDAGVKDNVIPTVATAVVNSRILPGQTPESVRDYLSKTMADERIVITPYSDNWWAPSAATSTTGKPFTIVAANAAKVMDSLVPAPFLMIGATDSRYFRQVSDGVINFSASTFMEGYHGIDERLPVQEFQRMYTFLVHVMRSIE